MQFKLICKWKQNLNLVKFSTEEEELEYEEIELESEVETVFEPAVIENL